ncbi:phage tail tape measure protein [Weissella minor]|uniref:phage tail tape measure protein n=1 Tax=Weissella minor TaxID=1620 RepID=UPI001BB039CC|nr:phage tail tape measure protein [Weissella minor]MBS0950057.1 phage tail tape measure protein [Weissella minor]
MNILTSEMVSRVTLDTSHAQGALRDLQRESTATTREWKSMSSQLSAAGDQAGAASARMNGLGNTIANQKQKIEILQQGLQGVNRETKAGTSLYNYLQKELEKAERQLGSYDGQLKRASETDRYYQSGLASLNQKLQRNTDIMHIREQRLQAQGREEAAAKTHVDGLKNSQESLSGILKIQERELNRVASQSGKTSEEYHKQAIRVEETKKQLAETRSELKYYQSGLAGGEQKLKELNTALTHNNELYKANADSLELQGRHNASLQTKLAGTKNAYATQNKELSKQRGQLKRLESAQDSSNESLAKQRAEVAKSEAKLAGYGKEIKTVQREVNHLNPFGFSKMGQGMNALYQTSNKTFDSMHRGFQSVRSGALNAAIGIGVVGAASIKGAQMASELENQYKTTFNLLVTGGEKAAEAQKNVNKMQTEGKRMSVEYGVSQSKIADGYQELVKRGYSSEQALGSMKTMLQGAKASGDDFTDVVHDSTAALESFGKKTDSVTGMAKNTKVVVNQMAFAADATATDFKSMGVAMEYTGATAHQSGLSLSETASAIGVLSNNGLEADKAGTGLRKTISSLQSPTKGAKEALDGIGLSTKDFVDKSGKMKSMTEIFGMLNQHTEKLSKFEKGQLFHTLFGATGQQAGSILAENSKQLGDLNKKVEDSAKGQGYVAELAKKNMGSVKNELAQFKEAGNATLIMIGKEMLPVLREASIQMVKTFDSKDGQEGLKTLAKGVGFLGKTTADLVGFLGSHKHEVEAFGAVLGAMWGLKKVGQFIILIKDAKIALLELKAVSTAMDFIGGGSIGKVGKVAKGSQVATTATKGVSSIGAATAGASEAEAVTSVAAKSAPALGKVLLKATATGVGGGVTAGLMEATSNKPMHEKVGGTIGGGVGTAVGMAMGGPFGAMLGGTVGQKAGELLGDAVNRGLKKKPAKITFKTQTSDMKRLGHVYQDTIDTLNRKLLLDPKLNTKSLESDKKTLEATYKRMGTEIDNFYKNKQKNSKKDLDILVKNGAMTQKDEDAILKKSKKSNDKQRSQKHKLLDNLKKDTDSYYKQLNKIQSGQTSKLQEIEKRYGKNSKKYKDEQHREELKANKDYQKKAEKDQVKLGENVNKTVRAASVKQKDILNDLKKKKTKISHEEMTKVISDSNKQKNVQIKNANKTYEKAKSSAEKKRDGIIKAADKEYYENGNISKKQHDDIVEKANGTYKESVDKAGKQKKETIDHATEQHQKVVDQATKQAGEHKDAVDDETGNVLTGWSNMQSGLADTVNDITDGINGVLKFIDKDHPGHIPKWTPKNYVSAKVGKRGKYAQAAYATGTQGIPTDEVALVGEEGFELAHHPQKGIFALGTKGPEVRPLDAGTSILPHDLSRQFMAMTAGLPAHKDGVGGFIGDAFNFTKHMFKDVESMLSKGAKGVLNAIEDKAGVKPFINNLKDGTALRGIGRGSINMVTDAALKKLKGVFDKAEKEISSKDIGAGGNWRKQIEKAAKEAHVSLGSGDLNAIMARINKESGGKQNIKQQIHDINSANGYPAQGLLQYIPPTFRSWAVSGHTNILSGYDQLMAMFNDSNWRSDVRAPGGWGPSGHRRLANGGLTTKHQMVEISENNQPEMTIPLSKMKSSRGYELLGQTVAMFAGRDNMHNNISSSDQAITELTQKFDTMLNYLANIAENTGKSMNSKVFMNPNEAYQQQSKDQSNADWQNLNIGIEGGF